MKVYIFSLLTLFSYSVFAQDSSEQSIQDLEFLIGTWKVREDNKEKTWWEESTRIGSYILDSTYIELSAFAVTSTGKKRTYLWLIHHNKKTQQFEMISMFSNWYKMQFDKLNWDSNNRILIIQSGGDPGSNEYHDRYGELVFDEDFNGYVWNGRNKYGDESNPSIWEYVEKGTKVKSP
ncbi:hypothetical protein [Ekhidna sp.]|uniref:hypothetical protein n=1 Tax=Ekhidna sp. TaxID=2608089 RepID=UPI003512214E